MHGIRDIWSLLIATLLSNCPQYFYRPQPSCGQSNIFGCVCQEFCSQWGEGLLLVPGGVCFWSQGGVCFLVPGAICFWSWGGVCFWSWGCLLFGPGGVCFLVLGGLLLAPGVFAFGPGRVSRPTLKGEVEGDLVQAHSQGGNWGGSGPGRQPRGKLRGIWSRPTAKGEIEGDLVQADSQGGNWGGSDPGPQPRGKLRGIWSRPTAKGEVEGVYPLPPADGYCCGRYASYWNAFLFFLRWRMNKLITLKFCLIVVKAKHPEVIWNKNKFIYLDVQPTPYQGRPESWFSPFPVWLSKINIIS